MSYQKKKESYNKQPKKELQKRINVKVSEKKESPNCRLKKSS